MKKPFFLLSLFLLPNLSAETPASLNKATFSEIPYYLKQLHETNLEGRRMELNKVIHDAAVTADLSDPTVVKKLEPIIEKIQRAADSGLDRPYLEGQSMWLMSAVQYFEREKLKKIIDIPPSDWMKDQSAAFTGARLSTFPDKILLHTEQGTKTVAESADIQEAVLSPDGKHVAFARQKNNDSRAEIWVVNLKNFRRKKIVTLSSCHTLLFSLKGEKILAQETPDQTSRDSQLYSIPVSGGKPRPLGKIRLLETLVEKGPYKGALIVYKNVLHHLGTTGQDCAHAIRTTGKEVGRLRNGPCR